MGVYGAPRSICSVVDVRSSGILTSGYLASDDIVVAGSNVVYLYTKFIVGSSNGAHIKVEFSPDSSEWYQESWTKQVDASGTLTSIPYVREVLVSSSVVIPVEISSNYMRVSTEGIPSVDTSVPTADSAIYIVGLICNGV